MSDYFSDVKIELTNSVNRRAHVPWWVRVHLPVRHRGLAIVVAALVVATPAVAAVGAVSGWFSAGKPDGYYRPSSTSGLGTVRPKGDRLLPIRVADPDGGPPWGIRLVTTSRGDTCIQVGRVEDGQIGALGIDGAWGDDHEFHEIRPNDGMADSCGATDAAGYGFVNQVAHNAPASVDVPLYNSSGGSPSRCRSPYASMLPALLLGTATKRSPAFKKWLAQVQAQRSEGPVCPASSMRIVIAGLLGPDAKSITYVTPSGQTETEQTSGGVGAYLIVFRETKQNCADFTTTLISESRGCQSEGTGGDADLQGPTAVTSVTYNDGKTCSAQPSPSFAAAYRQFSAELRKEKNDTAKEAQARFATFLAAHHLTRRSWFDAVIPRCAPIGWVTPKQTVTAADITSPLTVSVSEGRRFCSKGPWSALSVQDNTVTCDHRIPHSYTPYWESSLGPNGPLFALIRVSFTAREPVTTSNSFYEWNIQEPGNNGGGSNRTQANVRRGETVTSTMSEAIPGTGRAGGNAVRGVYHGTISFIPNVGQAGPDTGGYNQRDDGALTVGKFRFTLPPKK
jgi:hypothetical protein